MRHRLVLSVVDLSLIGLATLGAQLLRDSFATGPEQLFALLPYLGLSLAVAIPALAAFKLNRSIWRLSGMADYLRVLGAAVAIVVSAVGLGFLVNRLEGVARSLPIIQAYLILFGLVGVRVAARLIHAGRGRAMVPADASAEGPENILVVGINAMTELYLRSVAELSGGRIQVMGLLASQADEAGRVVFRQKILGSPEHIASVLGDLEVHGVPISRVVVTLPVEALSPAARAALLEAEESSRIRVEFLAEQLFLGERGSRQPAAALPAPVKTANSAAPRGGEWEAPARRTYWPAKRLADVAVAAGAIVVLSPLLLLVAVLVVIDVGTPTIFWQQRPGVRGRPFRLYKIRTMAAPYSADGRRVADADRLSAIGRFLRRFRLDELPQLFNVVTGEMSLIGPRPLLLVDHLPGFQERLAVRPGMTGWAQVKGGRRLSAEDKAALDVWYVRNASLRVDAQILAATLRVILLGERAPDAEAIRSARRELQTAAVADGRPGAPGLPWGAGRPPASAGA
jgi:lipopolysaccharide/colanic/teichoic acid biosynthesis glycosyltransferase